MKADLETGQATFVPLPEAVNDRSDLFTAEELAVFADRLTFYGYGRPGAVAIRKPGADPHHVLGLLVVRWRPAEARQPL